MTFRVGDTVVYPHHGAAIVEKRERLTQDGEERDYLVLRLTYGDLTLKVPADTVGEVGIRDVCNDAQVQEVLGVLRSRDGSMPTNWSRRFKANYEKFKSGDILRIAEVVRNLSLREQEKGLSAGEKRLLTKARQILLSELSAALHQEDDEAEAYLDELLAI